MLFILVGVCLKVGPSLLAVGVTEDMVDLIFSFLYLSLGDSPT